MMFEILLVVATALLLSLIVTVANQTIRSRLALYKFLKTYKGLPVPLDQVSWFSNHMFKWAMDENCQTLNELHKKHGKYLAGLIHELPCLSTTDLDLLKTLVVDSASKHINRAQLKIPMKELESDCILFARDDQWRRLRKAFAPALKPQKFKSPNVVQELETSVSKLIDGVERRLDATEKKAQNKPDSLDIDDVMHRFSLDVVLRCLYKQEDVTNFNLNQKDHWVEMVEVGLWGMCLNPLLRFAIHIPALRHLIDFLAMNFHPSGKWRQELMQFVRAQARLGLEARKHLEEMRQNGQQVADENNFTLKDGRKFRRNMVDSIVDQLQMGKITQTEYMNTSWFLFSAADKTTADALSFTVFQLAKNAEIQEKLRQSIGSHGVESQYLSWVINESLRLHPPVPAASRATSQELKLGTGHVFPPNTIVLLPLYTIHRLEQYWGDDADEFRPERWADEDKFHPCQFMPFGAGLRRCLGRDLALFEMRLLLCALLDRYRFGKPSGAGLNGWSGQVEFYAPLSTFLLHKTPLFVSISRVENTRKLGEPKQEKTLEKFE